MLYDIDEGIIKRSDGKPQLRPTTSLSNTNSTTTSQNSQISEVLPTNSNMQIEALRGQLTIIKEDIYNITDIVRQIDTQNNTEH